MAEQSPVPSRARPAASARHSRRSREPRTGSPAALVAYQEHAKRSLLHVRAASVLSAEAAAEMAEGIARLLEVPVAVATTGVAGDQPVDGVGPGVVFIATRVGDATATSIHRFEGDPEDVCDAATECALTQLVEHLDTERAQPAHSDIHSMR